MERKISMILWIFSRERSKVAQLLTRQRHYF